MAILLLQGFRGPIYNRPTQDEPRAYGPANSLGAHEEVIAVAYFLDEANPTDKALLDQAVTHPDSAIASDAVMWQVGADILQGDVWPLPANATAHPRAAWTHARVLGPYVREGKLSLTDAIRKATSSPRRSSRAACPR